MEVLPGEREGGSGEGACGALTFVGHVSDVPGHVGLPSLVRARAGGANVPRHLRRSRLRLRCHVPNVPRHGRLGLARIGF